MSKVIQFHNPRWKFDFESEAQMLRACFGRSLVGLHHIGSSAIPNIMAKPIIDILGEATSLTEIDDRASVMRSFGYEVRGAYGIEGRRYFKKDPASTQGPGYHVHVFECGSEHIARHLRFRDYLLLKPDVAHAYSALKITLSDQTGALVADYAARKSQFVKQIEGEALAHFGRNA